LLSFDAVAKAVSLAKLVIIRSMFLNRIKLLTRTKTIETNNKYTKRSVALPTPRAFAREVVASGFITRTREVEERIRSK
jgi:hypothetical protein